jgi:CBS domain containing-hemolysin-like protein
VLAFAAAALFIALNGFFVAAEFALVKVRATQLDSSERKGDVRAVLAQQIIGRLDRYLGVTQFGITVASLGLGWVGEPAFTGVFEQISTTVTGHVLPHVAHLVVVACAFFCLTLVHVLLGELVPKLYAIQRSEKTALLVARPIRFIYVVFRPVLWVLEAATHALLRAMGLSSDVASFAHESEADVLSALSTTMMRSPGGREKTDLVERVIRFSQRTARHAMVPRVDVVSLPVGTPGADAARFLRKHQFSRVLLTKDRSLDDVVGYLYGKDFWLDPAVEKAPDLLGVRRNVLIVAETQSAVDVMRQMQREETPIAVVVDEYGGTSGIVTMEDLLEEIVGEIKDELDEEPARVTEIPGERAAWEVDGRTPMEELRSFGVRFDEEEAAPGESIGAVLLDRLGRIPRPKDRVSFGNATLEVVAVQKRRVLRVRVSLRQSEVPPP